MRQTKRKEQLAVPMSAMIDVVFLLLVFFIVTYQEDVVESHTSVDRPAAASNSSLASQMLEVHVLPGAYMMMGNTQATLPEIAASLKMFVTYDSEQVVSIKVHHEAHHGELISLLDQCHKIGITNLNVSRLRGG